MRTGLFVILFFISMLIGAILSEFGFGCVLSFIGGIAFTYVILLFIEKIENKGLKNYKKNANN